MNDNLISVLERADNEDLKTLCDIITLRKDGTPRISDSLTKTEGYRRNYPHRMKSLIPGIVKELGLYGSNTFVSLFKGEGADYSAILRKVARRLKVSFRDTQSDEVIEGYMLQKLFDDMSERLTDEELRTMAREFGVKPLRYSRQAIVAALQMSIRHLWAGMVDERCKRSRTPGCRARYSSLRLRFRTLTKPVGACRSHRMGADSGMDCLRHRRPRLSCNSPRRNPDCISPPKVPDARAVNIPRAR